LPLICCALVAITLAAFWQVGACDFVGYDDPGYISHHPMVNQGLREAAIYWAWSAPHGGNWHPITTMSYMLDCTLFGVRAAPMHWENLGWHILNTLLVFLVWQRASRALWPSAFLAALFALHPTHVESVVWLSQRKDQLSTVFWLLSLAAYLRYVESPNRLRYAWVAGAATLALLSKPMAVTLPFTLLLFDYWPLQRWPAWSWRSLVWEKAPLFLLAGGLLIITFLTEHAEGVTDFGWRLSTEARFANAAVSGARYLGKTVWPAVLSPYYPYPPAWPWWAVLAALLLLVAGTWAAWQSRARHRWFAFGWCWFLGTLIPVSGLVQTGMHAMADRYTYVPLLGIFVIVAWGAAELARRARVVVIGAAVLALIGCLVRTQRQIPVWKDGPTLIAHLQAATGEGSVVYRERATLLRLAGRPDDEIAAEYQRGLEVAPDDPFFPNELGILAARAGRFNESRAFLAQALALTPDHPGAYSYLGLAGLLEGRLEEAAHYAQEAIRVAPHLGEVHLLLARIRLRQGDFPAALTSFREAVRRNRWDWLAWNELGVAYHQHDRPSDALECLERAVWINPGDASIAQNLATVRSRLGLPTHP
jgi:tetratricopeptide (TPR) repeat protein